MLVIHLRKQKLKLRELELLAYTGVNENNVKAIQATIDSYKELLFPALANQAAKQAEESFEEKAKRQLAEEARKVYVVRKPTDNTERLERIAKSSNPDMKALAARELREHTRKEARKANLRSRGRNKKLPKGTIREDR